MKYIIMCGGEIIDDEVPRHFMKCCGEVLIERTIRLLRENGITDIAISTYDTRFEKYGLPILKHNNIASDEDWHWLNAFYPMTEPVCYIFGDVFFSPEAIKKIVETETDGIEFFASAKPFDSRYIKRWAEPFAFKVVDNYRFRQCIAKTIQYEQEHCFWRQAISWELWEVIKQTPLNILPKDNYVVINDYSVDIDSVSDKEKLQKKLGYRE